MRWFVKIKEGERKDRNEPTVEDETCDLLLPVSVMQTEPGININNR